MATPQYFDDAEENIKFLSTYQAPKGQAQKTPTKKKNFWLDQISTAGGILGAIGGTMVAPIVGTAAGGAAGSAIGEGLENLITGDRLTKNVGKEAALGGVFAAGPIRAASLIGRTGQALAQGAGKNSLKIATEKALTDTPIRTALSKPIGAISDRASTRGLGLSPSQLTKVQKTTGGTPLSGYMRANGLEGAGPDDITKHVGDLNKRFGQVVESAGDISKNDITKRINLAMKELGGKGKTLDDQATASALKGELDFALSKFGPRVSAKELNSLKTRFDAGVNYNASIQNPLKFGTDKRAADILRDTLQEAADKSAFAGKGELKQLGMNLRTARLLEEKAIQQANNGKGSGPLNMRSLLGGTVGMGVGGPGGAVAGAVATQALNSRGTQQALARGAAKLSDNLSGATSPLNAGGIIKRVGAAGVASGGINQALQNVQPEGMEQSIEDLDAQLLDGPDMMQEPEMGQAGQLGLTREDVQAAMIEDMQLTGGKNIEKLKTLYEFGQADVAKSKELSSQASKDLSNSQAGLDAVANLRGMISDDPSLQKKALVDPSALGGLAGSLLGTASYDTARQQAVDVIARLRTGAAITSNEEKRFLKMLPQAFDSPDVANYKLGILEKAFNTVATRGGSGTNAAAGLAEVLDRL